MGHTLWLSIPSFQWSNNRLWSHTMNASPTYNKTPKYRIKCDSHHGTESTWQLCWYLVISKLTAHRHYRQLQTSSWSHRQSKLICLQLSKTYTINWIRFWTRSCCQPKRDEGCLKSWVAWKWIFDLCIPDPSAAAWSKDMEGTCYLLCPCFGRSR